MKLRTTFLMNCHLILCCYSKDGAMRNSIKDELKNPLLKDVSPSEPLQGIFRSIADGGAILVLCNFVEITLLHAGLQLY